MMNFEWRDEYSVGVDEIDAQHKRFISIMKEAYALGNVSQQDPAVIKVVDELTKYAQFHLQSEEQLMQLYFYPKYVDQKKEHHRILKELESRLAVIRKNNEGLAALLLFLIKWFVNHTTYEDRIMGEYINNARKSR